MNGEGAERRPRVVFVDHIARLSGGEIALLRLLPALAAYVDIHVILGEDGPLAEHLANAGIKHEVLALHSRLRDVRKGTVRPGGIDLSALSHLAPYVLRLSRRFRALEADLVHTNSLKAAFYGGCAARLAGVPAVWHIRDRIAEDYLPLSAVRLVRRAALHIPTAVVANSKATLETLPEARRSRVLYNPVVPDAVDQRWRGHRRSGDGLTIGIVGRLAPWKGQHVFLEAFAAAFRETEVRGRVIGSAMFGEDDYAAELPRQAERLGIGAQVEFRGFREDVWQELTEIDVLVHSSVSPEPFGQVILEGMAVGLPIVATAAGGPAELVTDGLSGLLTPPGDVGALADALLRLRHDPGLRDRLGAEAYLRSREFTPARAAQQLFEIYRGILDPAIAGINEKPSTRARPTDR